MLYFIVECIENICEQVDLFGLFSKVNEVLVVSGIFFIGGICSCVYWLDIWQMVDGKYDYVFVYMMLKIGVGCSLESCQEVGEMLFGLIKVYFVDLMENCYLVLLFEIVELYLMFNYK